MRKINLNLPQDFKSRFPEIPASERKRLLLPVKDHNEKPVDMILDTDTANEIDDQFALCWALLSPEKINFLGITAAPFSFGIHKAGLEQAFKFLKEKKNNTLPNKLTRYSNWAANLIKAGKEPGDISFTTPEQGMEKSYQEIKKILALFGKGNNSFKNKVFHGAANYLTSIENPVESEAVSFIIESALQKKQQRDFLYLNCIGAITNVASAILLAPEIIPHLVVVWTSAYPTWAHAFLNHSPLNTPFDNRDSFNLVQDPLSAQVVLASGVPFIYLPGFYVGEQLRLSYVEAEKFLKKNSKTNLLAKYLFNLYTNNPIHKDRCIPQIETKSWVIWDMLNIAWFIDPRWVATGLVDTPKLGYLKEKLEERLVWEKQSERQGVGQNNLPMREGFKVNRDAIFEDFFDKVERFRG